MEYCGIAANEIVPIGAVKSSGVRRRVILNPSPLTPRGGISPIEDGFIPSKTDLVEKALFRRTMLFLVGEDEGTID